MRYIERDLRDRGLQAPLLAIGDGAPGLWAALREVFPATEHQRCWDHRVLNVLDALPKRLRTDVPKRMPRWANAVHPVWKVVGRLGQSWRALNGAQTLTTLVPARRRFADGILRPQEGAGAVAA